MWYWVRKNRAELRIAAHDVLRNYASPFSCGFDCVGSALVFVSPILITPGAEQWWWMVAKKSFSGSRLSFDISVTAASTGMQMWSHCRGDEISPSPPPSSAPSPPRNKHAVAQTARYPSRRMCGGGGGAEATGSFIKGKHNRGPYGFNPANVYNLQPRYCPNHCFLASHKQNPSLWLAIIFHHLALFIISPRVRVFVCLCVCVCWGPERGLMTTPSGRRQRVRVWHYFCTTLVNEADAARRKPAKLFKTPLQWFIYLFIYFY